jgi:hypothetical protein
MAISDIIDSVTGLFKGGGEALVDGVSVFKGKLPPEEQIKFEQVVNKYKIEKQELEIKAKSMALDFMIKNEQPDRQPKWLITWKGLIRPAFATFFFLQLFFLSAIDFKNIVTGVENYEWMISRMPNEWWWIMGVIVGFYFAAEGGGRVIERMRRGGGSNG